MRAHFRRLVEHGRWANRRVLKALRDPASVTERSLGWLAHVLAGTSLGQWPPSFRS